MPAAKMRGVVAHWTAGEWKANDYERKHYHILIEDDGQLVRGIPSIKDNEIIRRGKRYAAHTLNCNSNFIGVSLCCMGGKEVKERPFVPGPYPLTQKQWETLPHVLADLCRFYKIPITPKTVLSHAEVQANLGIRQKAKWDISKLTFAPELDTARECGDDMRARVAALLA
jgi:N-acetyl-anhydromuramyl-L-alanine amidase AmpD